MTQGRWYPTLTTLADGRILTLSGEMNCQQCYAPIPEIYNPATNTWSQLASASRSIPWYPHAFSWRMGRWSLPVHSETTAATIQLDINTQTWTTVDSRVFESGSAAMYAPGKVLVAGTSTDSNTNVASTAVARVLDMNVGSPSWRTVPSMAFPRAYHVFTMLPDGNVLVTGGGRTTGQADTANAVYQAELWSPTSETWTTLSSMQAPRLYHGTALLMPDGRVLVSGGGRGLRSRCAQRSAQCGVFLAALSVQGRTAYDHVCSGTIAVRPGIQPADTRCQHDHERQADITRQHDARIQHEPTICLAGILVGQWQPVRHLAG